MRRGGAGSHLIQRCRGEDHINACAAALPLPLLRGRVGVGKGCRQKLPPSPSRNG